MTDRITLAFRALRKAGYFARQNFLCCQSCGCAAVPEDKAEKYVFYHRQDTDDLRKRGSCYLAFGGDGKFICEELNKVGIKTIWNGSNNERIKMVVSYGSRPRTRKDLPETGRIF